MWLFLGLQQQGLFRLSGSVLRTRQLRLRWDQGERVDLDHEADVTTVASLLKLFLRELPVPIVPDPHRKELVLSLTGTLCQNAQLRSNPTSKRKALGNILCNFYSYFQDILTSQD